jgi:uncharacterized protein YndB with AHSA1/START domain
VPKKQEMAISRVFNAPKELVFKAWADPVQIKNWWGPKGFTAPVIKVDLRKGGKYLEIKEPDSRVITDYFADENGNKLTPEEKAIIKSGMEEGWNSSLGKL